MKVKDIEQLIYNEAPKALAYEWDNTGLLCGNKDADVTGICVCLDVTPDTIKKAVSGGANTIVSHHPFIFSGIKNIDYTSYFGSMLHSVVLNNLNIISMHTNIDKAKNGINEMLAQKLGFKNIEPLIPEENGAGMGRMGEISDISFKEFCKFVSNTLNTPIKTVGNNNTIKKAAVVSGSGIDFENEAIKNGCDVLITGDVKYHQALEAKINIIDAGHYPTEIYVLEVFENILKKTGIKIIKSVNSDVFEFVI